MNLDELSKLKKGDIVRHEPTCTEYVVMDNIRGVPTALRSIQLRTGPDWSHVSTPTPVPDILSGKEIDLKALGWTFNKISKYWFSPDGFFRTSNLSTAYSQRHKFCGGSPPPAPSASVGQMATELKTLGWTFNEESNCWISPNGFFWTSILRTAWELRHSHPMVCR